MSTDLPPSEGPFKSSGFDPEFLRAGQRLAGVFNLKKVLPTAMGESPIWIAEDDVAEREVSLHFVPAEIGTDPDVCEALRTEVRRGRQLIHPNILRVHDLADEPAWSAVVMDSFEGQSLARLLQEKSRGFFEAEEVLRWLDSILQILADAHGIGLLHRDLNLHDLILTADDRIVISNFGLTRVTTDALRRKGSTDEGLLVYTSPQLLGYAAPTASDDIYSLGACLFELLTGHPVFEGVGIENKIRTERPPAVMECRQRFGRNGDLLFPNWEKVIAQCLSKNPSERPASILKIQEKLGFRSETAEPKMGPAVTPPPALVPTEKPEKVEKTEPEKAPVHMGVAGDDIDPEPIDSDARETLNLGPRRPLLTSPLTPMERERRSRNSLLLWILVAGGIGAGVWFGSTALVKYFSAKPPAPRPAKVEPDPDKVPEGQFVPPAAPGQDPQLTALRPGQPVKPKDSGVNAVHLEALAPGSLEPPVPIRPPVPPTQPKPAPAPAKEPEPEPVVPALDPRVEDAQKLLEAALARSLMAAKEYEKLKARKDPNASQRAAIAAAKKTKEQSEQRVKEIQKSLDEVLQSIPPPALKPVEPPKPEAPASKVEDPRKPAAAIENSIGMLFLPVGDNLFSMYETRVKDYAVFIEETGSSRVNWKIPGFDQTPDHPVVMVSWNHALEFCKWLTERERKLGILSGSEYYRLPTDVEWSMAVGLPEEGGKTPYARDGLYADQYPWGKQWPPPEGAGNFPGLETGSDIALKGYTDGFPWTAPVGSFKLNEFGLYDMSGNVWEWCMDTLTKDSTKSGRNRVVRGGSWYQGSLKPLLLSSCRLNAPPDRELDHYGFRVIRSQDGGKGMKEAGR
jgi:serine/threonine protein kinase